MQTTKLSPYTNKIFKFKTQISMQLIIFLIWYDRDSITRKIYFAQLF